MHRRILAVLPLGAVLVAMFAASPAQAANAGACQFQGSTTSLDTIAAPPGLGGSGSYKFAGPATCAINGGVHTGTISSNGGMYGNIVCGTGTATDTATLSLDSGATVYSAHYTIVFVAGTGTLVIDSFSGPGVSTGAGGGAVNITPANPDGTTDPMGCSTHAVSKFNVVGAFAAGGV
jgi:hypothetical protein